MIVDALVALLVTLILGALLVAALRWRRPEEPSRGPAWDTAALLLAAMYLVVFAGGRLLRPLGFDPAGATWTPFLLVGVLLALLILAVATTAPGVRPRSDEGSGGGVVAVERMGLASNVAGLLLLGLVAALMALWVLLLVL